MGVCVTNFSHVHLCILWNHQNLWWLIFFGWFYRSALTMNLHLNSLTIEVYAKLYPVKNWQSTEIDIPPQILMIPMFLFQCLSDHYIPNTCLTPQPWKRVVIMTKALCIVLFRFSDTNSFYHFLEWLKLNCLSSFWF